MALVFDIETDGLLDSVTKIHSLVIYDTEQDKLISCTDNDKSYTSIKEGDFKGVAVSTNKKDDIVKYELKLPTDIMFAKVHGEMMLHYTVYNKQKTVILDTITPEEILSEGHQKELTT